MSVELVTSSTPELVEAMERLIPQLSRTAPALTAQQCADLVAQPGVFLFVFRPDADAPTGAASQVGSDGQGAAGQAGPGAQGAGTAAGAAAPILGMLTLATFTIPTGLRAWVEDVVVDDQARGRGAGQALVEAAVAHATSIGARTVDLTSRPSREAANRLYRRAGFELRETNVYRYKQS
ncbi:N-acetyltransferase [uncultured Actinomyces sp.]|uniref:GNAT family N-acetyltransferase n=1 Tax=uncultured Actinomyces sp. TaxID=249061 RepID=UPI0026302346|nr:GNAT family N-acetyltransferase [uncultured Actinomyces sp.]